jgi:hypothetical protein
MFDARPSPRVVVVLACLAASCGAKAQDCFRRTVDGREVCSFPLHAPARAPACPAELPERVVTPRVVVCLPPGERLSAEVCAVVKGGCGNELDREPTRSDLRRDAAVQAKGYRYGRCQEGGIGRLEPKEPTIWDTDDQVGNRMLEKRVFAVGGIMAVGIGSCCPSAALPDRKICLTVYAARSDPAHIDTLIGPVARAASDGAHPVPVLIQIGVAKGPL